MSISVLKKLSEKLGSSLESNVERRSLRLMFQDEARFGRITDPRSCWAKAPLRPVINVALIREYVYEYAAVSPQNGALDFMTSETMDTNNMNRFLRQVRGAHPEDFIVMVLDEASSHKSKDLEIPEHMSLILLPPYSPELNPAERLWNVLRRDFFANRVFDSLKQAYRAGRERLVRTGG